MSSSFRCTPNFALCEPSKCEVVSLHVCIQFQAMRTDEPENRSRARCSPIRCVLCGSIYCCLILVGVLLAVIVAVILGTAYRGGQRRPVMPISDAARYAALYSPGSTRIISYGSSFFCGAIRLQSNSTLGLTLQLIDDTRPPLTRNEFTIKRSSRTTVYWSYYLYHLSAVTFEYCTRQHSDGDWVFLMIRGRSSFQSWMRSPDSAFDDNDDITASSITNDPCFGEFTRNARFNFLDENEYFFVFYNRNNTDVELNITISVDRFEYAISSYPQPVDCSTVVRSSQLCRLNVPIGSNYRRALVAVDIPNNVNWEEYIEIDWHCESRAWAYIVVVLGSIAVIIVAIVIICTCVWRIKKRHCQKTVQANEPATEESDNIDPLNGEQDLTAIPPPSYTASLAYPLPTDEDKSSPPSYIECTTNNV